MTARSLGKWKLPQPTDVKDEEGKEWSKIPRISRIIPFGYEKDIEDPDVLNPIPLELEAIEMARKYVKQYSFRQVANWLTQKTGREISHVGLRKRLMHEQQRKNQARTLRKWSEYAQKAIEKAKAIEEERLGSKI
jgi:hypothetical protein